MTITPIEPIVPGSQLYTRKGMYSVQVEIPPESTLTERDIDSILAYASWENDPNTAERIEGGRSIVIGREQPRALKGLELKALQISGICYNRVDFERGSIASYKEGVSLTPPSVDNFMDDVSSDKMLMATTVVDDGKLVDMRPSYRAKGTYLESELKTKVKKTRVAASLHIHNLVASPIEAVGRYLDKGLSDKGKQFGFVVVPIPDVTKERLIGEIYKDFGKKLKSQTNISPEQKLMLLFSTCGLAVAPLYEGLRELHEQGRHVHFQAHLSNAYSMGSRIYMMDWSTMQELNGKPNERLLKRAVDIQKPTQNLCSIFAHSFGMSKEGIRRINPVFVTFGLELYRGGNEEITTDDLWDRADEAGVKVMDDFDLIVQWMKDQGYEGFEKYAPKPIDMGALLTKLRRAKPF